MSDLDALRLQTLIENYREAREEGMKLTHSGFNDIAFATALIVSVAGGGTIAKEPSLLLILPLIFNGFGLYAIQKFRINGLVTSHMIFLEREINKTLSSQVMIWNTHLVRRSVSAERGSMWGRVLLLLIVTGGCCLYFIMCAWTVNLNHDTLCAHSLWIEGFWIFSLLFLAVNLINLVSSIRTIRKHTPDYIANLLVDKPSGSSQSKKTRNQRPSDN
jgi:hypothetical protein